MRTFIVRPNLNRHRTRFLRFRSWRTPNRFNEPFKVHMAILRSWRLIALALLVLTLRDDDDDDNHHPSLPNAYSDDFASDQVSQVVHLWLFSSVNVRDALLER